MTAAAKALAAVKRKARIEPARSLLNGLRDCPNTVNLVQGTVNRCYRGSRFKEKKKG